MKIEFTNPAENEFANGNLHIKNTGMPFEVDDATAKTLFEFNTVIDGITVPRFQEAVVPAAKLEKTKDKEK